MDDRAQYLFWFDLEKRGGLDDRYKICLCVTAAAKEYLGTAPFPDSFDPLDLNNDLAIGFLVHFEQTGRRPAIAAGGQRPKTGKWSDLFISSPTCLLDRPKCVKILTALFFQPGGT